MPLAAISMLILALMVMLDLNVLRSVHEKIRLQNFSDEQAFSVAVAEARSFNYYVYANRAIASAYVGAIDLSAYESEVSMVADAEFGMFEIFEEIAAIEQGLADACFAEWNIAGGIEHEIHFVLAELNAIGYILSWLEGTIGSKVQGVDSDFASAISAYVRHADIIWGTEIALAGAAAVMLVKGDPLSLSGDNFGSNASLNNLPGLMGISNLASYANALKTSDSDSDKITAMTSVVNATRPPWAWDRGGIPVVYGAVSTVVLSPICSKIKDDAWIEDGYNGQPIITQGGINLTVPGLTIFIGSIFLGPPPGGGGIGAMNQGGYSGIGGYVNSSPSQAESGDSFSSKDNGMIAASWHDGAGVAGLGSFLGAIVPGLSTGYISSGSSNTHNVDLITLFNDPHKGGTDHGLSSGLFKLKPAGFMEYKIDPSPKGKTIPVTDGFNQPVVWWGESSNLNINDFNVRGPWEINPDGAVTIDLGGPNGKGSVQLSNPGSGSTPNGYAISKATTYYHRLGDWQEAPNFWNPYWRAKLDSFNGPLEATAALTASGYVLKSGPGGGTFDAALLALGAANLVAPGSLNIK